MGWRDLFGGKPQTTADLIAESERSRAAATPVTSAPAAPAQTVPAQAAPATTSPATTSPDSAAADPSQEILELVRAGEKIEAIKLYREQHGVGLKDAKDAIDAMARGEGVPTPATGPAHDDDVEALARRGEIINAVKLYMQRYDVGLKEAKAAVDRMH